MTIPAKNRQLNDYSQVYPAQPQQPLVFNDPSLQRTASFSARPQVYQAERQIPATYSTYSNNNNNNNNNNKSQSNENLLELYYSTKTSYNRSPNSLNNLNNFNTSSSMNLTPSNPNPMSSGFFHFNNNSPPAPPIYPSTPTR